MVAEAPGFTVGSWRVDDASRADHGDPTATAITLAEVEARLRATLERWPRGSGARLHILIALEPPG